MKSLKILTSYRLLDITSLDRGETFLRARGDNFDSTKFCIVDGHIVTEFALVGKYTLLIYPPDSIATSEVRSVAVVAESSDVDDRTLMNLGVGYDVRGVSGAMRLVQLFVFVLLSTPGSYILNKTVGGRVVEIMRKGAGASPDRLVGDLVAAIRKTEDDIKGMQAGMKLPASELLLSVNIIDTSVRASDGSVTAFVELVTLNGSKQAFNIGI